MTVKSIKENKPRIKEKRKKLSCNENIYNFIKIKCFIISTFEFTLTLTLTLIFTSTLTFALKVKVKLKVKIKINVRLKFIVNFDF